ANPSPALSAGTKLDTFPVGPRTSISKVSRLEFRGTIFCSSVCPIRWYRRQGPLLAPRRTENRRRRRLRGALRGAPECCSVSGFLPNHLISREISRRSRVAVARLPVKESGPERSTG